MARNPNKKRCTATNRKGKPCGNWAKPGYNVCHYHGAGGGAPKGNKNSVSTHEHESIIFDFLEDDEKELLKEIDLNKLKQIDNDIRLIDIRLRRMMQRIAVLSQEDMATVKATYKKNEFDEEYVETKHDTLSQIQNIEEAITRVQGQKLRLIKAKHELEMDLGINLETKEAQLENIKAKTENLKGVSDNIEDTSELRRLLLDESD